MALQVVYANDVLELTADNVATAWASCAGCTGTAVAVQVVVARSAKVLLPGNHALALNVGCVGCHTTALAMQFVLVTPSPRALSADARAEIEAVLTGIPSSVLRPVASARVAAAGKQAGTPLDRVAMTLQTIAAHDLGATSSSHTVQMRVG
jgi:mono/diheme cytochrome c family protein